MQEKIWRPTWTQVVGTEFASTTTTTDSSTPIGMVQISRTEYDMLLQIQSSHYPKIAHPATHATASTYGTSVLIATLDKPSIIDSGTSLQMTGIRNKFHSMSPSKSFYCC